MERKPCLIHRSRRKKMVCVCLEKLWDFVGAYEHYIQCTHTLALNVQRKEYESQSLTASLIKFSQAVNSTLCCVFTPTHFKSNRIQLNHAKHFVFIVSYSFEEKIGFQKNLEPKTIDRMYAQLNHKFSIHRLHMYQLQIQSEVKHTYYVSIIFSFSL